MIHDSIRADQEPTIPSNQTRPFSRLSSLKSVQAEFMVDTQKLAKKE
jgi:hypothetical protein